MSKKLKILLVEDDSQISEVQQILLTESGYEVEVAGDAKSALAAFGKHHFDLLVSDIQLPDQSGLELAAAVRASRPNLPILFVTGLSPSLLQAAHELPKGSRVVLKGAPIAEFYRLLHEILPERKS